MSFFWNKHIDKNDPLKQALNNAIGEYLAILAKNQASLLYSPEFPILNNAIEGPVVWDTAKIFLESDRNELLQLTAEILADKDNPLLQKVLTEKLLASQQQIPEASDMINQAQSVNFKKN